MLVESREELRDSILEKFFQIRDLQILMKTETSPKNFWKKSRVVNLVKLREELRLSLREILGGATGETLAATGNILKNSLGEIYGRT